MGGRRRVYGRFGYRFSRLFGLGGTLEYTGHNIREGLAVVSFGWYVWKELKLYAAPGMATDDVFVVGAAFGRTF